jgi:hypothetical protein
MNSEDPPAKEILQKAFLRYSSDPETSAVTVADQILLASTKVTKVDMRPTALGQLAVTIGDQGTLLVDLPDHALSSFRAILARFGTIARAASKKKTMFGRINASLISAGIFADDSVCEQKDKPIQYVRASFRKQVGSPLYKLDAELDIKKAAGDQIRLRVTMNNESDPKKMFLQIEPR